MKTITVEDSTWEWLSNKRIELRAKSLDEIIKGLIAGGVVISSAKVEKRTK